MKQFILLVLLIAISACNKAIPSNNSQNISEENYVEIEELTGVWASSDNDLYYIAFYPNGRYTFCISDQQMGFGTYSLDKNTLTLNDNYTYKSDNVELALDNNTLNISGYITTINGQQKFTMLNLTYSTEELSPSVAGRSKSGKASGISVNYSEINRELTFTSDNVFTYKSTGKLKSTGKWKTLQNDTRLYVYRKPYTYCYLLNNEEKTLEIFDFSFLYSAGGVSLGFSIESYRVK